MSKDIELNPELQNLQPIIFKVASPIKKGEAILAIEGALIPSPSGHYISLGIALRDLGEGEVITIAPNE